MFCDFGRSSSRAEVMFYSTSIPPHQPGDENDGRHWSRHGPKYPAVIDYGECPAIVAMVDEWRHDGLSSLVSTRVLVSARFESRLTAMAVAGRKYMVRNERLFMAEESRFAWYDISSCIRLCNWR